MSEEKTDTTEADFGRALSCMRKGGRVRRKSWRKNVAIFLKTPEKGSPLFLQTDGRAEWRWSIDQASVLAPDWEKAPAP
jgi:hypothetical protein